MIEYDEGLRKIIKKRISAGYNYLETLRTLYGADPREVWDVFKKFKKECNEKIGMNNFYHDFPEPHPAFSQWRLTPQSTIQIIKKISDKKYDEICFLGCPVLGLEFGKKNPKKTILLDIDTKILEYAKKFTKVIIYDVNDPVPVHLKNKFECVVTDPPWYPDDVKLFIQRASELAKLGGTIYFSLPCLLTRPSILRERLNLQKWLSLSNFVISEIMQIAEYEVPPFEYITYYDIPAFSGETWRRGDWVKLKKVGKFSIHTKHLQTIRWLEYSINGRRIFLRDKPDDKEQKPKLSFLYNDGSLILKTVSKRTPLLPKIDIWTSRNAVLHIDAGFHTVKMILDNINQKDEQIIEKIIRETKNSSYKKNYLDAIRDIRALISV
ncbi:MAG TPA: bis-aminopropyl spermidine synthase family protein [Candidatus Nanoarchaeia archaeon]|nr:bis-aminopropyl spermidine synthase family protein [Candidatus Nanoarchaeia archaeon]